MERLKLILISVFLVLTGATQPAFSNCSFLSGNTNETFSTSGVCGPTSVSWDISFEYIIPVNPAQVLIRFEWGDPANTITDVAAICVSGNTSCSPASGAVNFTYPLTSTDCEFSPTATVAYDANNNGTIEASELCSGSTITRSVRSWSNDDFGTGSLAIIPSVTQQCVGEALAGFQFQDNSTPNCNTGALSGPNQLTRSVQFVYGTTNESGPYIPNVSIDTGGGFVQITNAAGAIINTFYGPIIEVPPLVGANDLNQLSYPINYGSNSTIGDIFEVTLRNWNICNPYDNLPFDGIPPVNVQDGDNSPVTESAKIEIIGPTVSNAGADQQICGASTFLAGNTAIIGTGQWQQVSGPGTLNFSNQASESTPISISGNNFGTYELEWIINLGTCISRDTVSVTFNDDPSDPFTGPDQAVCGLTTNLLGNNPSVGSGTWVQVGGPSGLTINTPSSPTSSVTATSYGVYTFEWRISNANCPVKSEQQEITFNENPSAANAGADLQLCGLTANLNATPLAVGMGQWTVVSSPNGASTGFSDIGSPTASFNSNVYGDYDLVWTASNGNCPSNSDTVSITLEPSPTPPNAGSDIQVCGLTTALNANIPVIGNGSWVQVSGPSSLVFSDNLSNQSNITATSFGVYKLAWQTLNAICPVLSDTVQVTFFDSPPIADAGNDQSVCGLSTTLGANVISSDTTATGTWSILSSPLGSVGAPANPNNPNTVFFSNTYGVYELLWTADNGVCPPNSDTVVIQFNNDPTTPNAGPDQDICGLTASLSANVPSVGTGIWIQTSGPSNLNFSDSTINNSSITAPAFGTYILEWRISNANCPVKVDPVQITFFDNPSTADAGPDQVLCGTTASLAGNSIAIGNGLWSIISSPQGSTPIVTSPTNSGSTFSSDSSGVYILTWEAISGPCNRSIDTVQITFADNPDVSVAGPDQFICGDSTSLAANNPLVGIGQWVEAPGQVGLTISNPGSPNTTITAANPGTYILEWQISNANCPINTDAIQIIFYDSASAANAGADRLICGLSTSLEGNPISVGSGFWSLISSPQGSNPTFNTSDSISNFVTDSIGQYVLQWTSTNGTCPADSDRVRLTFADVPNFTASQTSTLCYGDCNGTALLTATKGQGPFFYSWSGSDERIGNAFNDLCAGNYQVTITDQNGCSNTNTINITDADSISTSITVSPAGCNLFDGSVDLTASGGTGNLSFHWNTGVRTEDINTIAAGIYVATITDANNCVKLVTAAVNNPNGPSLSVNNVNPVSCNGLSDGDVDMNIIGNDNVYLWSNGANTEDLVNLQAGPYYLVAFDTSNSCASVISVNVPEPDEFEIDLNVVNATCANPDGSAVITVLGGNGNNTINWSSGGTGSSVGGLLAGVYNVTVSDFKGCSEIRHFAVSHDGSPGIFTDSIIDVVCNASNGAIYISTTGNSANYSFLWSNGDTTEDLVNVPDGLYSLQLTDTNGCQSWYVNTIDPITSENPSICMVQVDERSNFNQVIWKPLTDPAAYDHFNVYRESTRAGVYQLIGTRPADSVGIFDDVVSNPLFKSYRYKLSVVDTCGTESQLSEHHKTIHLVQVPGLPGTNTVNLLWDDYEGFPDSTYFIYRNSAANGFELIDSLAAGNNSYTDTFNVLDTGLFYVVMVETPGDCDPTKDEDFSRTRSNPSSVLFIPDITIDLEEIKLEYDISIYPVPAKDKLYINTWGKEDIGILRILDVNGNVIISMDSYNNENGIDIKDIPSGVYILRATSRNMVRTSKFIKE